MLRRSSDVETSRCLAIEDLVAMVEGTLPPERSERVVQHVDRCADCAEMISNLGSLEGPERRVGRYQIERLLGTGGMGVVYEAFDPELQRRVAIKLVRPDSTSPVGPELMLKEARTLARLSHPGVIAVHDVGEHDGEVYITTELVDGVTLADWQLGRTPGDIVGAWIQVARGLAAAHAEGIVHRDVKPANVLVGRDGRVRIGDFGIAQQATADPIDEPTIAGTPAYMAPEQKSGRVDARSDQFSTAVALVEGLTGTRPAAGATIDLAPPALAEVLTRALSVDPDARFASMSELADALARTIAPPPPRSRTRVIAICAAAAAIGTAAVIAVVVVPGATKSSCRAEVPSEVWSPRRRDNLDTVLPGKITPVIERQLARWSSAAADACADRPEVSAVRRRCLDRTLAKIDRLLAGWEAQPPKGAMELYVTWERLPHVEWCSAAGVAAAGEPAADEAPAVVVVESLLETVKTREDAHELVERARATNYQPLVRAARRKLASLSLAEPAVAIQLVRDAIAEGPDDFSKVVAITDLLQLLGADAAAEADALVATARTLIAKLGGDVALEASLDYGLGTVLARTDRRPDALAAFERMRQGTRTVYGADSPYVAMALVSLAGEYYARDGITSQRGREAAIEADAIWKAHRLPVPSMLIPTTTAELLVKLRGLKTMVVEIYGAGTESDFDAEYALTDGHVIAGQPEQALVHARRADELARKLELKSARTVAVRNRIVMLLIELGRAADAIPIADDAIATAEKLGLAEELAFARMNLGHALVETGQLTEARQPLTAALRWQMRTNQPARARGHTRFYLAMATGSVEEARLARGELATVFETPEAEAASNPVAAAYLRSDTERSLARIDAWIAQRK